MTQSMHLYAWILKYYFKTEIVFTFMKIESKTIDDENADISQMASVNTNSEMSF